MGGIPPKDPYQILYFQAAVAIHGAKPGPSTVE